MQTLRKHAIRLTVLFALISLTAGVLTIGNIAKLTGAIEALWNTAQTTTAKVLRYDNAAIHGWMAHGKKLSNGISLVVRAKLPALKRHAGKAASVIGGVVNATGEMIDTSLHENPSHQPATDSGNSIAGDGSRSGHGGGEGTGGGRPFSVAEADSAALLLGALALALLIRRARIAAPNVCAAPKSR